LGIRIIYGCLEIYRMQFVASEWNFFFYNLPSGHIGKETVIPFTGFDTNEAVDRIASLELGYGEQDGFGFACDKGFLGVVAILVLDDKVLFLPGFS